METEMRRAIPWRGVMWATALVLLLAPAVAMQFTSEVNWGPGDFAIFAAMLAAVCAGLELTVRLVQRPLPRLLAGLAILCVFLLVWAQLAVGIL